MAGASPSQLLSLFVLLFLTVASWQLPLTTAVDACTNSPDISNPLCARCDCNPNDAPKYTKCNDASSATTGFLLINNDAGQQDFGTKYMGLGRYITQAQCCATCQADNNCDAFNFISSGGAAGCYLLSNTNCNGHVYTKQIFGAGSCGTGGVPARVNMCPDACSASPAIYDPLCGANRQVTSCTADDSSYTIGKLLMTGQSTLGYGIKYAGGGQFIQRQQCCEACQANPNCNAFNFINSGGGMGCYFLTSKECRDVTYAARTFPAGSFGTGGSGAQHNLCPGT